MAPADRATGGHEGVGPQSLSPGQGPAWGLASIPSPAAPKVQPPGASLALIASDPALRLTVGCPRGKKVKVAPLRRAVTQGRTPPRPPSPRRPHLPRALEMQASEFSALKGKPEAVDGQ